MGIIKLFLQIILPIILWVIWLKRIFRLGIIASIGVFVLICFCLGTLTTISIPWLYKTEGREWIFITFMVFFVLIPSTGLFLTKKKVAE